MNNRIRHNKAKGIIAIFMFLIAIAFLPGIYADINCKCEYYEEWEEDMIVGDCRKVENCANGCESFYCTLSEGICTSTPARPDCCPDYECGGVPSGCAQPPSCNTKNQCIGWEYYDYSCSDHQCVSSVSCTQECCESFKGEDATCINGVCTKPPSITTKYLESTTHKIVDVTNENSVVTRTIYDKFGKLVEIIEAKDTVDEVVAKYEYDLLGNLKKITNPEGHVTTNYYNTFGQLIKEEHPDTGVSELKYDLSGNLINTKDALGRIIKRNYDILNRIKYIDYDDDGNLEVQYFYDNECGNVDIINSWGRICKIIDLSGTIEFVYDNKGRINREIKTIDGRGYTTDYGYNFAGNLISIIYPNGRKVIYNYSNLQQLESVQLDADNDGIIDEEIIEDYDYNPSGTINQISFGRGITTTYDYTIRDWLESIDSGSVFQRSYIYDPVGNMEVMYNDPNLANKIAEFNYDNLNRLINVDSSVLGDKSYTYDKVGNRMTLVKSSGTKTYEYDYEQISSDSIKLKRITTSKSQDTENVVTGKVVDSSPIISMEYASVGNLISDTEGSYYIYDHENRLIQATIPGGSVEMYVYDYLGNRIKKISGDEGTLYLYDLGSTLIEEINLPATSIQLPDYISFEIAIKELEKSLTG